jgi:DNA-3-methyladenine glycosylase II
MKAPRTLTQKTLTQGVHFLSERDSDLNQILKALGPPPMWTREPGFATLLQIILEQQVSLASAKAAFERLLAAASPLTPERFLRLNDTTLKEIGFSRQKTMYGRHLAQSIIKGQLNLTALEAMEDVTVRSDLVKVKGIGPWTADIYLLMALRRPDIWPSQDLALAVAVQKVKRLSCRPTPEQLKSIAAAWRPWRAVAARLLWHYYLSRRPE